jgi:hypothetical protein
VAGRNLVLVVLLQYIYRVAAATAAAGLTIGDGDADCAREEVQEERRP